MREIRAIDGSVRCRESAWRRYADARVSCACGRMNPMKMRYNDASVSGRLERGPRWIQEVFA